MSFWRRAAPVLAGMLLVSAFAGCSLPIGGPTPVGPVGTPQQQLTVPCATKATASAHSWVTADKQITGSINGGAVGPISNFAYPLGLPNEDVFAPTAPGYTAWAPDGAHLATLVEVVVPGEIFSYPYVVDTSTHVASQIPLPVGANMLSPIEMEWARERSIVWEDNNDLLILGTAPTEIGGPSASQTTSYRYALTTNTVTPLSGVSTAIQGEVRCGTLYYLRWSQMKQFAQCENRAPLPSFYWFIGGASLERYTLATGASAGQPFYLGQTTSCPQEYDNEVDAMGWDVSADGSLLIYQQTSVLAGAQNSVQTSSRFMAVKFSAPNAQVQILLGAKSNANAYLALAPNQKNVALVATDSLLIGFPSSAFVYTGALAGSAAATLSPQAGGLPAWYADSTGFDASQRDGEVPGTTFDIERFQLGASTPVGVISKAHHPASLP